MGTKRIKQKRDKTLKFRCTADFLKLLQIVKRGAESDADIMHQALAKYARQTYIGKDFEKVMQLCQDVEETDNTAALKRREKFRRIINKPNI